MIEQATLVLDSGEEVRVEVDRDDLSRDEFTVRRIGPLHRPQQTKDDPQ